MDDIRNLGMDDDDEDEEEDEDEDEGEDEDEDQHNGSDDDGADFVDDSDSDGDEDGSADVPAPSSSRPRPMLSNATMDISSLSKQDRKALYKPASNEEIMVLRETDHLFKSNLFRMQISALLDEVKINYSRTTAVESALHQLKTCLEAIPDATPPAASFHSSLCINNTAEALQKFRFAHPDEVSVIGSYLVHTVVKPVLNVDVAVRIPASCLNMAKDVLNYRYHDKRHMYLAVLAAALQKHPRFKGQTYFSDWLGDHHKQILVVKPLPDVKGVATHFCIRIIPFIAPTTFKLNKLTPDSNNLRPINSNNDAPLAREATPHYNQSILEDMTITTHLTTMHTHLAGSSALTDAALLLKVWARQRNPAAQTDQTTEQKHPDHVTRHHGSLRYPSGFHMTMILVHLASMGKVNKHMSSYQMVRIALHWIATTNFQSDSPHPIVALRKSASDTSYDWQHMAGDMHQQFRKHFDGVFLDGSGVVNLFSRISSTSLQAFRHDAILSLQMLGFSDPNVLQIMSKKGKRKAQEDAPDAEADIVQSNARFNASDLFETLFLTSTRQYLKYDAYVHIDIPQPDRSSGADYLDNDPISRKTKKVVELLERALGDRVTFIHLLDQSGARREWRANTPASEQPSLPYVTVVVALIFESSTFARVVDHGPDVADTQAADEWNSFWGERSQVRRFKDGSIKHACVWEVPQHARHTIPGAIASHILCRHLALEPERVHSFGQPLDVFINSPGLEDNTIPLLERFRSLSNALLHLPLPLKMLAVQATSPNLRHTAVVPQALPSASTTGSSSQALPLRPVHAVILFEKSHAWPLEASTLQQIKFAFYVQIAHLFNDSFGDGTSQEGDDGEAMVGVALAGERYLEITWGGHVFHFTIQHPLESQVLREGGDLIGAEQSEIIHQRAPQHHKLIYATCLLFPSFGSAARLAKRWMHTHMFGSSHVPEEVVELLVARVYALPFPYAVPTSHLVAFFRFLDLIATFDWSTSVLVVDLNGDMQQEDARAAQTKYEALAEGQHRPALLICTPHDRDGSHWTRFVPTPLVWSRVVTLAKRSVGLVQRLFGTGGSEAAILRLFQTPMRDYDALIYLDPSPEYILDLEYRAERLVKSHQGEHAEQDEDMISLPSQMPVMRTVRPGYDPVRSLIQALILRFGDIAMFFYDQHGGTCIGVVWNPSSFIPRPLRATDAHMMSPVALSSEAQPKVKAKGKAKEEPSSFVAPHRAEIVEDMKLLGSGLILDIDVLKWPTQERP
eukprot:TRINITY_DN5288_c0_g1_i2.p1 TRINITY_DN5288_c0_g1~~TRINITY_DN5288_c0_g1_i2.p1  ORF type:complete len:1249 (-),score=333.85 TRINITY_DN5288_c0_g1_i2:8-3754(-)